MKDEIFNKAMWICCKMSEGFTCYGCPLYKLKIAENGSLNFLCLSHHDPTHKAAEVKHCPKVSPIAPILKPVNVGSTEGPV